MRVLVVEDDEQDFSLLAAALEQRPENILLTHVSTLEQALVRPAHDAILLDLGLPDSQGPRGLIELRKVFPDVPIVVLTGTDDPRIAELALRAGARDFITKSGTDLNEVFDSLLFAINQRRRAGRGDHAKAILEGIRDPDSVDHLLRIVNDAALAGPVVVISTQHAATSLRRRWLEGDVAVCDLTGAPVSPLDRALSPKHLEMLAVHAERALAKLGARGTVILHTVEGLAAFNGDDELRRFCTFLAQRVRSTGCRIRFLTGPGPLHADLGMMLRPIVDEVRVDFETSKMGGTGRGTWM